MPRNDHAGCSIPCYLLSKAKVRLMMSSMLNYNEIGIRRTFIERTQMSWCGKNGWRMKNSPRPEGGRPIVLCGLETAQ